MFSAGAVQTLTHLQPLLILLLINGNPPGVDTVNAEMNVPLLKGDQHLRERAGFIRKQSLSEQGDAGI